MKSIAVIGDLVGSKNIKDRHNVQQKLQSGLNLVNRANKTLTAPYRIILGDEFQAVYNKADRLFFDLLHISLAIYPHQIRFVIGIGEITAKLSEDSVVGMDGPAFYSARDSLSKLKKGDSLFFISSEISENKLINQSLALISEEIKSWNENRLKVFVSLNSGWDVSRIAGELNISQRAVYKSIKDGAVVTISDTFKEINAIINRSL
jgi:hypothetical protein